MVSVNINDGERLKELAGIWNELRTTGQFVDATIQCRDGVTYPVHKVILSSNSQFFRFSFFILYSYTNKNQI